MGDLQLGHFLCILGVIPDLEGLEGSLQGGFQDSIAFVCAMIGLQADLAVLCLALGTH
jgi:hypothetical protein